MKLYWLVMAELSYSIKGTNGLLFITLPNCFNIRCKWVPVILLDCLSLRMQDLKGHKAPVSVSSRLLFVSPAGSQTVWWQQGSRSWASHDAKALECIPRRMTTVPANSRQSTLGTVWNTPHPHPQLQCPCSRLCSQLCSCCPKPAEVCRNVRKKASLLQRRSVMSVAHKRN